MYVINSMYIYSIENKINKMKNLKELKKEKEQNVNQLNNCKVFFAFSNDQFKENKTELNDGEKYVSIGMGGYCPESYKYIFNNGLNNINELFKIQVLYELFNH